MSTNSRRASRADHVALRRDDAPQRRRRRACRRGCSRIRLRARVVEDLLLELVEPVLELLHLGPVVIDHRVDDAVEQRDRSFAQDLRVARDSARCSSRDRPRVAVVDGDEIVRAEEEVDVVRVEAVLAALEVDAVQDDVEVAVVGLDLRVLRLAPSRPRPTADGTRTCRSGSATRGSTAPPRSTQTHAPAAGLSHAAVDARRPARSAPFRWTKMVIMSSSVPDLTRQRRLRRGERARPGRGTATR